jgi:hypothetical protein
VLVTCQLGLAAAYGRFDILSGLLDRRG